MHASRAAGRLTAVSASGEKLAHAPRLSLIVLPFANLRGDPEQDYFADGLTDDLTTDLTHLPDSFVIGRSTAAGLQGQAGRPETTRPRPRRALCGRGSARRVGETITLNAQLFDRAGAHIWADRFDGEREKLGELQVESVSRHRQLRSTSSLFSAESLRAMRGRQNNPDSSISRCVDGRR